MIRLLDTLRMKLITNRILALLLLIFIIALAFRIYALDEMPSGFHRDEVISGYAGRFVLQNGQDIYGNVFPLLYIDKYGDFPPAIPMYFSGLATFLFGVNVFAVRFGPAFLGALTIIPIYFLALLVFKKKSIAIFSSLFLAVLPWHIVLSRSTAEGVIALFFAISGLILLLKYINTKSIKYLLVSIGLLLFTYFLYPSYRILVPLIFAVLPFMFKFKKKERYLMVAVSIFFILVTAFISTTEWGRGRLDQTSMFGQQSGGDIEIRAQIFAQEEGSNKISEVKTYHNKAVLYAREFMRQYISYYSPQYLFTNGGLPYRYTVSDQGLLYYIFIPLLLIALLFFKDIERRYGIFLVYLAVIAPMPSPLTLDDVPNVHRSLFMIVPLTMLAAFGLHKLISFSNEKKYLFSILITIFLIMALENIYFSHMYFNHANMVKSIERGDANKEVINYIIDIKSNYDSIYVPVHDAYPIYYLFFSNNFDKSVIGNFGKSLRAKGFDNIVFTESYCPSKEFFEKINKKGTYVFADREDCPANVKTKLINTFTRHDGTMSFRVLETQNN